MTTKQLIFILILIVSQSVNAQSNKILKLEEWTNWYQADSEIDTILGINLKKTYKFLEGKEGQTVIVGILDGGVDILHEDFAHRIWINEDEIENNGIDDDKNGYIDDINGWNFVGNSTFQGYEDERIVNNQNSAKNNKTLRKAEHSYKKRIREIQKDIKYENKRIIKLKQRDSLFAEYIQNPNYTLNDIFVTKSNNSRLKREIKATKMLVNYRLYESEYDPTVNPIDSDTAGTIVNEIKVYQEYYTEDSTQLSRILNNINYKRLRQDNPDNFNDTNYGNNNVSYNVGNDSHGTHVAGIIAANRKNHIGINGISDNSKIMPVRILGDDDEYDKDVALAIRYAVDNGAKIINASFCKNFSPHKEWVYDAIRYAEKKDVLIVIAAGNDALNLDKNHSYPNDSEDLKTEFAHNVIVVGASNPYISKYLTSSFSNYGTNNVDIFAPGNSIYSTIPENKYGYESGTSMAASIVTGIAALIRSYYPILNASEIKQIILDSGIKIDAKVIKPGHYRKKTKFSKLCSSGSIVNAYYAILMADRISNKKEKTVGNILYK